MGGRPMVGRSTDGRFAGVKGRSGAARRSSRERAREYGLAAGELGSSGGQTIMVTLLPVLLARHAPSAAWIGAIIAAEGAFALVFPYLTGSLSDRLPPRVAARFGRRTIFLLASAPVMAAALMVTPFQDGFWLLAIPAFAFFAGLNVYTTLLRTLVIELVPRQRWGRVQGFLGLLHMGGLGYGIVAGGLLFSVWEPLPFPLGAALILLFTATTYGAASRSVAPVRAPDGAGPRAGLSERVFWRELARRPDVGWYLVANALWSGAVDGLRPYIFLYGAFVLGTTVAETSVLALVLLAGAAAAALVFGKIGDRLGRGRVLEITSVATAIVMALGTVVRTVPGATLVLVPAGIGAAAFITLPYPVFAELARKEQLGRFTGVYGMSIGLARVLAPLAVGHVIDLGAAIFPDERGYPMLWPVVAAMTLLGAGALRRADRHAGGEILSPPRRHDSGPAGGR